MEEEKDKEKEETKEEKKEEKNKLDAASRFVKFLHSVLDLLESTPKAVAGIAIILSLIAGTTGAWGTFTHPQNEDIKALEKSRAALEKRVHDLEIWNAALREITQSLMARDNIITEKIKFDGFLLDLDSGDVEPPQSK